MALKNHRAGRCWACGDPHLSADDPSEHIVQSALGGALTTDRFAKSCNRQLGRRVDQPFLRDFLIAVSRARHGIRDPRRPRRPPPNPRHHAKTAEGQPVVFDWRDGGMILPPHIYEDDERVVITAETEEEARKAAEAKIGRMRQGGQKFKPDPAVQRKKSEEPIEARMELSFSTTIRARAAAKIALGAFSLVLPEEWLNSEAAKLLQSWLWDETPKTADGGTIFASPQQVPDPMDKFCRPPEHLLFFMPSYQAHANFGIALFGEEFTVVSTGPLDHPAPETAWCLDPLAHTTQETTFSDLVIRARHVYAEQFAQSSKR